MVGQGEKHWEWALWESRTGVEEFKNLMDNVKEGKRFQMKLFLLTDPKGPY